MMHSRIAEVKVMSRKNQDSARRKINMQAMRDQGMTDVQIGRAFGITAERVAQILGRKWMSDGKRERACQP